jgi:hypothetical protein
MMKLLKAFLLLNIVLLGFTAKAQQRGLDFAVTTVIKDYFEIKNALFANNAGLTQNKADKLIWDLNNVPTKDMNGPQHDAWFNYLARLQRNTREISENNSLAVQRKQFSALSNTVYGALKDLKINSFTVYRQYCSSIDAYWLSDSPTIRNPYFGIADKKMGKDGVTKEILPAVPQKK